MEATELMCDDIVLHNGNAYKVFGVMGKANAVDLFPVHIRNAEGLLLGSIVCFAKYIEPIPLTPEILEKNGFWWGLRTDIEDLMSMGVGVPATAEKSWVWEDENGSWVTLIFPNDSDGGEVQCQNDSKYACYGWLNKIYIHDLQHALRLCGLNDLADNFKI